MITIRNCQIPPRLEGRIEQIVVLSNDGVDFMHYALGKNNMITGMDLIRKPLPADHELMQPVPDQAS